MKFASLILLTTILSSKLLAQTVATDSLKNEKSIRICTPSRTRFLTNQPLYVINKRKIMDMNIQFVGKSDIKSIYVLNKKEATIKYGLSGNNGAIEIELKDKVKILSAEDLFKKFKISSKNWNLPVIVEQTRLVTLNDFYIAEDKVKDVKIIEVDDKLSGKPRIIKIWLKP
ncbi:hypothetical protein [Pedobacter nototheniae]|uniref:hypothetical protein n=1 Tax=Pedobacter nototheniae TaxID=2488994 RepID=UPI00103D1141|nr:hypothetical protein [Pedobacter nototheniae]